jgi:choline dehydrogenase-like flavoprotein
LIEAGGHDKSKKNQVHTDRWIHRLNPTLSWGYETVPQKHLNDRRITYDRGKGLGGSSQINFSVFQYGFRDDYDEIARLVEDDEWTWSHAEQRFKRLLTYHLEPQMPDMYKKYFDPVQSNHGQSGPLHISIPPVWERELKDIMDVWEASGYKINTDLNNGTIGLAVGPSTLSRGYRTTATDLLEDVPSNLTIITDAQVERILFEGKRATGIRANNRDFLAGKEIILCAGALDSPKLLMLSGVGPAEHLQQHNIPLVQDLPQVGKGLKDHYWLASTWIRAEHTTDRPQYYQTPELQAKASEQFEKYGTGPLADNFASIAVGFFKHDALYASEEFKSLPNELREYMLKPTVPAFEVMLNVVIAEYFTDPPGSPALSSMGVGLMNTQSTGEVTLQSSDYRQPLLYDPKCFSHPFDRRVAIEATRALLEVAESPAFAKDTVGVLKVPKSKSDEDILEYWRENAGSMW